MFRSALSDPFTYEWSEGVVRERADWHGGVPVVRGVPMAERAQTMQHVAMKHVLERRRGCVGDGPPAHGPWRCKREEGKQGRPGRGIGHKIGTVFGQAVLAGPEDR